MEIDKDQMLLAERLFKIQQDSLPIWISSLSALVLIKAPLSERSYEEALPVLRLPFPVP